MNCPHCGNPDPGGGRFCIHCGQPLPQEQAPPQPEALPILVHSQSTSAPQVQTLPPPVPGSSSPPMPVVPMGGASISAASIWGPFAGRGTRGRHVAWLLDDLGDRAEDLRRAVTERFQRRTIPGAQVQPQILTAKGVLVEQRPYYLIQRGRATTGVYLAKFGQDLYISQVSYFQGPVSTLRVLVVLAMAAFVLIYPALLSDTLGGVSASLFGGISGLGEIFGTLCCLGPLYLASFLGLTIVVVLAVYRFITEKDLLRPVRVQPNEFDQDDLIALEKAVEQTVREALDVVGIARDLMQPAASYGIRERII